MIKSQLRKIFEGLPIVAVYLFGSRASGRIGPISDYDFAVLFDVDRETKLFDLKLQTLGRLKQALGTEAIDVVELNRAPSNIAMVAIARGKLLYSTNEAKRINFEAETISRYLDRDYYESIYNKNMRQQILAGSI